MIKYIKELKYRFILLSLCWVSVFLVVYYYKEILLFKILQLTVSNSDELLSNFIFTDIIELFNTYLKLLFFMSNQISIFYFFHNLLFFLSPGLYYYEYKLLKKIFQTTILLWILTLICLNKYLAPFICNFFLNFQENLIQQQINVNFNAKISEFLTFIIDLYYSYSIQMFIFASLLLGFNYFENIKYLIKQFRKYFYFLFLLISTFTTPPEIISQFLVYISLIFFFELILLIRLFLLNNNN